MLDILKLQKPKKPVLIEDKRFTVNPNLGGLTPQQSEVFEELVKYSTLVNTQYKVLLAGWAGTGKTYVINMFVEWLLHNKYSKVCMAAPTNKAVKVLKDMAQYRDANLQYKTIHSLLSLREKITSRGKQIFVQDKTSSPTVNEYDYIIVDEASMVNDELLVGSEYMQGLFYLAKQHEVKIIFLGDPLQIPPVNAKDSLPFDKEKRKLHYIKILKLTDIVRQAKDNPIIKVTLELRKAIGRDVALPIRVTEISKNTGNGVYYIEKDILDEVLLTYFNSKNYEYDSDFVKVIAWTNNSVNYYNSKIRGLIHGENLPKILMNERLIVSKPIKGADGILFNTNQELEVKDITVVKGNLEEGELTHYLCAVTAKGVFGDITEEIRIVHEESDSDYELILDHLSNIAKEEKQGTWQAAEKWQKFFKAKEAYADVKYSYCITAHRSQGSTYTNAIVIEEDIDRNRKVVERNRIKYTACTRPTDRLIIVNTPNA